ncbi:MAG: universal stress protein [Pseudomonadota bacterium]
MAGSIMVLFDALPVLDEAARYAIDLAERMDCGLIFLFIHPPDTSDSGPAGSHECGRAGSTGGLRHALKKHVEAAGRAGVPLEAEVRIGDPVSELMKFLAGSGAINTIVWAGMRDPAVVRGRGSGCHWLKSPLPAFGSAGPVR